MFSLVLSLLAWNMSNFCCLWWQTATNLLFSASCLSFDTYACLTHKLDWSLLMAQVKANHVSLPKAEPFSSKDNSSLASERTTQLCLLHCSKAVVHLLEDPGPWILLIFLMSATVPFDCFAHFSPAVAEVNLNVHCKWRWLISILCYQSDRGFFVTPLPSVTTVICFFSVLLRLMLCDVDLKNW